MTNAIAVATELMVKSNELEEYYTRNEFMANLYTKKGCPPHFETDVSYIYDRRCYTQTCICSIHSTDNYVDHPEWFPKVNQYNAGHESTIIQLRQIEKTDNGVQAPEAETVVKLPPKEMWAKCLGVIQENQAHYYESIKSWLAVKRIRSGIDQNLEELVLEQARVYKRNYLIF